MQEKNEMSEVKITVLGAVSVMLFLIAAVTTQVFVYDNSGAIHITLIFVIIFASSVAIYSGHSWKEVQAGILHGCHLAMLPMLILMMVGVLISSWIAAGTIPAFIYYGIMLLSPEYFLFSACSVSEPLSYLTFEQYLMRHRPRPALQGDLDFQVKGMILAQSERWRRV